MHLARSRYSVDTFDKMRNNINVFLIFQSKAHFLLHAIYTCTLTCTLLVVHT